MHAELQIGTSRMMLAQRPDDGRQSPKDLGGTNATVQLYVKDADAVYKLSLIHI